MTGVIHPDGTLVGAFAEWKFAKLFVRALREAQMRETGLVVIEHRMITLDATQLRERWKQVDFIRTEGR